MSNSDWGHIALVSVVAVCVTVAVCVGKLPPETLLPIATYGAGLVQRKPGDKKAEAPK